MADRHTTIFGDQIDASALGAGIEKDVNDNLQVKVDDSSIEISTDTLQVKDGGITNDMLAGSIADGKLVEDYIKTSEVDDSTIEFNGGSLNVKALGITNSEIAEDTIGESKIDIHNAPSVGKFLGYTSNGLEWTDAVVDSVQESDVVVNEIPTGLINSSNTDYTLANTPVAGTVAVFLNGMYQAPGSGLDYTISGTTISFSKAPHTNSDLYVTYIIDN